MEGRLFCRGTDGVPTHTPHWLSRRRTGGLDRHGVHPSSTGGVPPRRPAWGGRDSTLPWGGRDHRFAAQLALFLPAEGRRRPSPRRGHRTAHQGGRRAPSGTAHAPAGLRQSSARGGGGGARRPRQLRWGCQRTRPPQPPSPRCGVDGGRTLLCQRPWNVGVPSAAAARDEHPRVPRVNLVSQRNGSHVGGHVVAAAMVAPTSLSFSPPPQTACQFSSSQLYEEPTYRRGAGADARFRPQLLEFAHPTANGHACQPAGGYKKGRAPWSRRGTSRPRPPPPPPPQPPPPSRSAFTFLQPYPTRLAFFPQRGRAPGGHPHRREPPSLFRPCHTTRRTR